MSYLSTAGEYEKQINRGALSFRSRNLDALVDAINKFIVSPRRSILVTLEPKLNQWKQGDPKEFANRGQSTEAQLRKEIADLLKVWGKGEIGLVDPSSHPAYEPGRWNDRGLFQMSTNCYAYACNDLYGHPYMSKPQPGQIAGLQAEQMEGSAVRYAVMADDLHRDASRLQRLVPLIRLRGDAVPDHVANVAGYYLIALVTALNADYHWLRQDNDGMWSHKPGWGEATNLDSDFKPIYDPREAAVRVQVEDGNGKPAWANYEFTTFYYAPKGGVRTGALGNQRSRRASI
jgi:hypothetical protein